MATMIQSAPIDLRVPAAAALLAGKSVHGWIAPSNGHSVTSRTLNVDRASPLFYRNNGQQQEGLEPESSGPGSAEPEPAFDPFKPAYTGGDDLLTLLAKLYIRYLYIHIY